jgi:hypothetical protein
MGFPVWKILDDIKNYTCSPEQQNKKGVKDEDVLQNLATFAIVIPV